MGSYDPTVGTQGAGDKIIEECEMEEDDDDIEIYLTNSSATSSDGDKEGDVLDDDENNSKENGLLVQRKTEVDMVSKLYDNQAEAVLSVCKNLKPLSDYRNYVKLGEITRHKTLILDMDETLLHAMIMHPSLIKDVQDGDYNVKVNDEMSVSVKLRPYLDESLNILSQLYEIVIFTAAEQGYADAILNKYDD